jgi:hypothetical protein
MERGTAKDGDTIGRTANERGTAKDGGTVGCGGGWGRKRWAMPVPAISRNAATATLNRARKEVNMGGSSVGGFNRLVKRLVPCSAQGTRPGG